MNELQPSNNAVATSLTIAAKLVAFEFKETEKLNLKEKAKLIGELSNIILQENRNYVTHFSTRSD